MVLSHLNLKQSNHSPQKTYGSDKNAGSCRYYGLPVHSHGGCQSDAGCAFKWRASLHRLMKAKHQLQTINPAKRHYTIKKRNDSKRKLTTFTWKKGWCQERGRKNATWLGCKSLVKESEVPHLIFPWSLLMEFQIIAPIFLSQF